MENNDLRKQAWDFFQMQASQRLTTFNFYIAVSSLLCTGLAASFKEDFNIPCLGIVFGCLLILFSFIFWKLDLRNVDLIEGAEDTLKFFETESELKDAEDVPHVAKKFLREEHNTNLKRSKNPRYFWKKYLTYSDCFRYVFIIFGIAGILGIISSIIIFIAK
jgi:hypothetical protein